MASLVKKAIENKDYYALSTSNFVIEQLQIEKLFMDEYNHIILFFNWTSDTKTGRRHIGHYFWGESLDGPYFEIPTQSLSSRSSLAEGLTEFSCLVPKALGSDTNIKLDMKHTKKHTQLTVQQVEEQKRPVRATVKKLPKYLQAKYARPVDQKGQEYKIYTQTQTLTRPYQEVKFAALHLDKIKTAIEQGQFYAIRNYSTTEYCFRRPKHSKRKYSEYYWITAQAQPFSYNFHVYQILIPDIKNGTTVINDWTVTEVVRYRDGGTTFVMCAEDQTFFIPINGEPCLESSKNGRKGILTTFSVEKLQIKCPQLAALEDMEPPKLLEWWSIRSNSKPVLIRPPKDFNCSCGYEKRSRW